MDRSRVACLALLLAAYSPGAMGQLAPPMIRASKPIGAAAGDSAALEVRGSDFRDGTTLLFDDPRVKVEEIDLGPADRNGSRTLKARVTIPDEVGPGPLRFRVEDREGVSNPGRLLIGRTIPTASEREPNNAFRKPQLLSIPVAIEGEIAPGDDVDVFSVDLKAGETLVAEAIASRAGSRLDSFVTIFGPDGRELAANDDRFGRDAAAWATVPATGRYLVAIQDAEGRHRDGGIEQKTTRPYRLEVGRLTLITSVFPGGVRRGQGGMLRLQGANLPEGGSSRFDPSSDSPLGDRAFAILGPLGASNAWNLRVGDLEEHAEPEPNGKSVEAPVVLVPAAINGTFSAPGGEGEDLDVFRLRTEPGREGDYAITAYAARIGSPSDPVLASLDAKGDPQGEDDDKLGRDARIERRIDSKDGLLISARDYYGRAGGRFTYRIEVTPIGRGVEVAVDLGHRTVPRSGALIVPVSIERKGFEGPVTILAEGLPAGVASAPVTIEGGESKGLLAFSAGPEAAIGAFSPRLAARDLPATFRFLERGPLDEVPREGDQNKGPRETVIDAKEPVLAVAEPAALGLSAPPGPIAFESGGRAEVTFRLDRRGDSGSKRVKIRLLAAGKDLERFVPVAVLDLAADASTATFALKPKPGSKIGEIALAAHAWFEGAPEGLGVDSTPVIVRRTPRE